MSKFIKTRIYCNGEKCCFDDIKRSGKPEIVINAGAISSIGPTTTWGFCDGHLNYPYKVLSLVSGEKYLIPLEEARELESQLV